MATNTAIILGLANERGENLHSELRRRRFWACYLLCSYQSKSLLSLTPNEQLLRVSLPCRDYDFDHGLPRDLASMTDPSNGSLYAELIKATVLW